VKARPRSHTINSSPPSTLHSRLHRTRRRLFNLLAAPSMLTGQNERKGRGLRLINSLALVISVATSLWSARTGIPGQDLETAGVGICCWIGTGGLSAAGVSHWPLLLRKSHSVVCALCTAVVVAAVLCVQLPFRICTALSRPSFTALVDQMQSDPAHVPTKGDWIGVFKVETATRDPDGLRFTCCSGPNDESGFAYFFHAPPPSDRHEIFRPMGRGWYTYNRSWD
jgi:hypothetical protein